MHCITGFNAVYLTKGIFGRKNYYHFPFLVFLVLILYNKGMFGRVN